VPPIGNRTSPVLPVEQVARGLSSRAEAAAKSSERKQRTPAGARSASKKNLTLPGMALYKYTVD